MKLFLSWSGTRSSAVASALYNWLPRLIQAVDPWMSTEADKGAEWDREISERLQEFDFVVTVLTPENIGAPWLHYEVGAFAAKGAPVWSYLVGLGYAEVRPPLSRFQHTLSTDVDTWRLLLTINKHLERPLKEEVLREEFLHRWPALHDAISAAAELPVVIPPQRTSDDVLAEVLDIVRDLAQQRPAALARRKVGGESVFGGKAPVISLVPEFSTIKFEGTTRQVAVAEIKCNVGHDVRRVDLSIDEQQAGTRVFEVPLETPAEGALIMWPLSPAQFERGAERGYAVALNGAGMVVARDPAKPRANTSSPAIAT